MNYIEEALWRQAALFAVLLSGGPRREEDGKRRMEGPGEEETQSGKKSALRDLPRSLFQTLHDTEGLGRSEGFSGDMAEWNRLLSRRGEGRLQQATGTRELTDADIPIAESMGAEHSFVRSGRTETARLNAGRNAVQRKNGAGTGQGFGRAGMASPEGVFFEGGGINAGTVLVVDGGVRARELSRTFQRDARRYDGGYPLY